ncbi:hypothetical protein B484DRAFT_410286, partial [Ochromonadaceae sp. CCMP2298]
MGAGGGMGGGLGAVGTSTLPSSPSATFTQASVLVQAGAEFLLPGAYVERTLSMCALRVAPLSAVLRVEYADLVYDEDDLFEIPLEHQKKRRTRGPVMATTKEAYMADFCNNNSTSWTALLDCDPLLIPLCIFLKP